MISFESEAFMSPTSNFVIRFSVHVDCRRSNLESLGGEGNNDEVTCANPCFSDIVEEVNIQTKGTCPRAVENDHDLNPSDKESLTVPLHKLGSVDLTNPNWLEDSSKLTSGEHLDSSMLLANHSEGAEIEKAPLLDSSPSPAKAFPPVSTNPPPTSTKGFGLKKWRRIRREITKDASVNLDSTKMLKRGSANISDVKQPNDGSVLSTNAVVNSPGVTDPLFLPGSSSNYRLPIDATFSAGADSDNSEDRSSKSSTAASAPKCRYDVPRASGHLREKQRVKNISARNVKSGGQRFQLAKVQGDPSKKPRGGSVNLEKENSLSSMESDSRSSNSVFIKGTSSVISDQVQNGMPVNYDTEGAIDQLASEEQCAEELPAGHIENISLSPNYSDGLSWSANKVNGRDHQPSRGCDPLVDSILMLQSAQDALEREVQKFGEIGKGICSLCDDLGNTAGGPVRSLSVGSEVCMNLASGGCVLELDHAYLSKNVQMLERQLNEAEGRLKEKELRIFELETALKSMESSLNDVRSNLKLQMKRGLDMEAELEGIFWQKLEAEVQYVVITRSAKELSVLVEDLIKLLEEGKSLAREQPPSQRTITGVGNKAVMLQGKAEKTEALYTDMEGGEEILKMQRGVVKFTSCLSIQLILLVLVFGLFVLQLLPKATVVVPT